MKYSQKLESEGKCLYDEAQKDFFELCDYTILLINHLHWENREHYFELIEEFLNEPIKFLSLSDKHKAINEAGERLEGELILLEPNPNSEGFGRLIDNVISVFDRYHTKAGDEDKLSDFEVKNRIQRIFKKMKDRFPLNNPELDPDIQTDLKSVY